MKLLYAFLVGGVICAACQLILDKTKLTPARLLVGLVVGGALLSAVGLYQPLYDFAGGGAFVPLLGFGHTLAQGAIDGAREKGLLGAFTGGLIHTAAGISAAIVFGFLTALIFPARAKK